MEMEKMTIINDDVLHTILTSIHQPKISIRIIDWQIEESIVKPGNNFSSQVSRLIVQYQSQDQLDDHIAPKKKIFFLKVPNLPKKNLPEKSGGFYNEVTMYTSVLPQMYEIDNNDEYFTPRQYYSDDTMSLILDDVSQSGYKCANRVEQLDFEHCFYVLKSLAKFHALSVKLENTIGLPESIKRDHVFRPGEKLDEKVSKGLGQGISSFIDILPENLKDRYPDTVEYFRNLSSPEVWTEITDDLASNNFKVLNHGDVWISNLMFKYDQYGAVQKVKLVDFQLTTWMTPVKDLVYLIVTSVKFEVYKKYFPLMMKIYLDTLNRVLRRLDCPTYEMCDLLRDVDMFYPFALAVIGGGVLRMILSEAEDSANAAETCEDEKKEINDEPKTHQKRYRDIAAKWFEHFALKGTLRIDE